MQVFCPGSQSETKSGLEQPQLPLHGDATVIWQHEGASPALCLLVTLLGWGPGAAQYGRGGSTRPHTQPNVTTPHLPGWEAL